MTAYFDAPHLLESPPVRRAAYSDRTAWIMAELSRLVYEPLPAEVSIQQLAAEITQAVASQESADTVEALVKKAAEAGQQVDSPVIEALREGGFELLDSFDQDGTQAFLTRLGATDSSQGMLILAFRGTQLNASDIFTDIKADLVAAPGGGRAHRGFLEAFQAVEGPIRAALERHAGEPVYLTGHSLGGALAILATRYLERDSLGACYTFGGPRAADDDFFREVKTPVYRVVHAADGVARVPLGYTMNMVLAALRWLPVSGTDAVAEFLRKHMAGYTHFGYMVFLNAADGGPDEAGIPFRKLKVHKSPNFFRSASVVLGRWIATRGKAAAADHSVRNYSEKLQAYALRRNGG